MRKFRRAAKPAIRLIKHSQRGFDDLLNGRRRELAAFARKRFRLRNRAFHQSCLLELRQRPFRDTRRQS